MSSDKVADKVVEGRKSKTPIGEKRTSSAVFHDRAKSPTLAKLFHKDAPRVKKPEKSQSFRTKSYEDPVRQLSTISSPSQFQHKVHVDLDFQWSGEDPTKAFTSQCLLGQGAYGSVFKCKHEQTGLILAIKKIKLHGKKFQEDVKQEIDLLKKCRHSNIVSYYGSCFHEGELWILMDYCALGSVADLISDKADKQLNLRNMKEEQIASLVKALVNGVVYLHANRIVHRDIKCANLLINDQAEIKLADFGVSSQLGLEAVSVIGTPLWMAPELIQGNYREDSHSPSDADRGVGVDAFKADIWSMGITVMEMCEGHPPHHQDNLMRALYRIGMEAPPKLKASHWSSTIHHFLAQCLNKQPHARPSAMDLLQHPFILTATPPHQSLRQVMEHYRTREVEQTYHNQLWLIVLTAQDLTLKTTVSPLVSLGDVLRKLSPRFAHMGTLDMIGLFHPPTNTWLEDAKRVLDYRHLKDKNEVMSLHLKLRPDAFLPDSPTTTKDTDTIPSLRNTIHALKLSLSIEQDRNCQLEKEMQELKSELTRTKEALNSMLQVV
eukprot:TRINITY_DN9217_c0_g1_i1.p1 TRINITY_DN9217_c0_g1~~TRINITY_DN9217_c0_g1_i1.p1  ORF type:complete len:549 (-),score=96.41 TRINITY_DN9217_c0_g1_i1:47-1693(-)